MATNRGRRTYDTSARIYSPCATDTGKQGELELCRYLHIGIQPSSTDVLSGTSVDYWLVTAKQGEVHHPGCSNANHNHNTNPNLNPLILS